MAAKAKKEVSKKAKAPKAREMKELLDLFKDEYDITCLEYARLTKEDKPDKGAAGRIRKSMQEAKKIAQEIRNAVKDLRAAM